MDRVSRADARASRSSAADPSVLLQQILAATSDPSTDIRPKLQEALRRLANAGVDTEHLQAISRAVLALQASKRALAEQRLTDAEDELDRSAAELERAGSAFPKRAASDLRGRIEGSRSLIGAERQRIGDSFERKATDPLRFERDDGSELNLFARSSAGWAALANHEKLDAIPDDSGSTLGKPIKLSLPSPDGKPPTRKQLLDAVLERMGPRAVDANTRYRAETGRDIAYIPISDREIRNAWNKDTKTYDFAPAPTQSLVRVINAYEDRGIEGARAEVGAMQAQDLETSKKLDELQKNRTAGDTVLAGVADGAQSINQLGYNVSTIGKALYTDAVYGTDSPEWRAGERQDRQNLKDLSAAAASMPEENSSGARIVRGVVGGGVSALPYMLSAELAGPYGPVLVGYAGNIHRGNEEALKSSFIIALSGGAGELTGGLTAGMKSRLAGNLISRTAAGTTNTLGAVIDGETDPRRLAEQWVIGASMPVGKRGEEEPAPKPKDEYRPLPSADRPPDASSLPVRSEGYTKEHDPRFTEGMAKAIGDARNDLDVLAKRGNVAPDDVQSVLDGIGAKRKQLQLDRVLREAEAAKAEGRPWPEEQLAKKLDEANRYGAPLPEKATREGGQMKDFIDPDNRHADFIDRAQKTYEERAPNFWENELSIEVGGKKEAVNLSMVTPDPDHPGGYMVVHPSFEKSRALSRRAYELYAEVLNDKSMTEPQAFSKIAEANYLLMHGTPFQQGSPASIESLNDAVMRARFGKTFPKKKPGVEPFWEAMFEKRGQAGLDDFVARYRSFYE